MPRFPRSRVNLVKVTRLDRKKGTVWFRLQGYCKENRQGIHVAFRDKPRILAQGFRAFLVKIRFLLFIFLLLLFLSFFFLIFRGFFFFMLLMFRGLTQLSHGIMEYESGNVCINNLFGGLPIPPFQNPGGHTSRQKRECLLAIF